MTFLRKIEAQIIVCSLIMRKSLLVVRTLIGRKLKTA